LSRQLRLGKRRAVGRHFDRHGFEQRLRRHGVLLALAHELLVQNALVGGVLVDQVQPVRPSATR
jgi:hypothetical protein